MLAACWERGLLIRTTGDTIALSPPLIVEESHIDQIVGTLARRVQDDRLSRPIDDPRRRGGRVVGS